MPRNMKAAAADQTALPQVLAELLDECKSAETISTDTGALASKVYATEPTTLSRSTSANTSGASPASTASSFIMYPRGRTVRELQSYLGEVSNVAAAPAKFT